MPDKIFVNVKMPVEISDALSRVAREYNVSRSHIVRIAVSRFLKDKRIVGISELLGGPESDAKKFIPVPVVIVDKVVDHAQDGEEDGAAS